MGYILINEDKFKERTSLWNNSEYKQQAEIALFSAKASTSHLLEALRQEEKEIDEKIWKLQAQKNDIEQLMRYAKEKV